MPKDNLKDKLEGNEIDLSLNNLTAVPVKELAEIPKATHLDLSCNLLADLPDTFCSLTYLVKIDLSKNLLTSLPDDFGNLTRLQYLDLLGNKLTVLPVSVYQLTKLKWLDLKDNPLAPEFKAIAGDCLDEKQCKKCAKDIVDHMRIEHNRIEKKLQIQRDDEKKRKAAADAEFEAERKRIAEEKKRNKKKRQKGQKQASTTPEVQPKKSGETMAPIEKKKQKNPQKKEQKSGNCCFKILWGFVFSLALITSALFGTLMYCQYNSGSNFCEILQYESTVVPLSRAYVIPYVEKAQGFALNAQEEITVAGQRCSIWIQENGPKFTSFVKEKWNDVSAYVVEKWNEFSALVEWQYKSFLGKGEEEPAQRQAGKEKHTGDGNT